VSKDSSSVVDEVDQSRLLLLCLIEFVEDGAWYFYCDDPYRNAGHVGLGGGLMSQSAARLKPPA